MNTNHTLSAASVLERFPDDWQNVVQLCRSNEDFRELCDHYSECLLVLSRLQSEGAAAERQQEYQMLVHELEHEIEKLLAVSATSNFKNPAIDEGACK